MIRDVKSYFNVVLGRLSGVFRIEDFSLEKEAEFWNLGVEYLSKFEPPSYESIVNWVDTIYQAPIHLVYRKQDEKHLNLLHRHLLPQNFSRFKKIRDELQDEAVKMAEEFQRQDIISLFEQQISNIDTVIDMVDEMRHFGRIKLSIGECEMLPLYDKKGLWGVYCVGPYVIHPKVMDAKITIVARSIARMLAQIEKAEHIEIDKFEIEANERIGSFGLGTPNVRKISRFFIRYICNYYSALGGMAMEYVKDTFVSIANYNLNQTLINGLIESLRYDEKKGVVINHEKNDTLEDLFKEFNINDYTITPFLFNNKNGFLFLAFDTSFPKKDEDFKDLLGDLANTFGNLLDFRERNDHISESVINTYYHLLRGMEKSNEETYYHTPRMIAFAEQFASMLELDEEEKNTLVMAAKLHDIGYTGAIEINENLNVGGELEHPLIGELMIRLLPVHQDVKSGIRTHHEWVNGSGTPKGLHGNEISWTGKILGILEFITEFIENHQHAQEEEWDDLETRLIRSLIDRTDKQFDIVLVPIAIDMLRALKWEKSIQLGTS